MVIRVVKSIADILATYERDFESLRTVGTIEPGEDFPHWVRHKRLYGPVQTQELLASAPAGDLACLLRVIADELHELPDGRRLHPGIRLDSDGKAVIIFLLGGS